MVGASPAAVTRWRQAYEKRGDAGLRAKPHPGRPPKLSMKQRTKLIRLLERGPRRHGYRTELWTLKRVAEVIRKHFGVRYDPSGVWHVLRQDGLELPEARTSSPPARRASHRTLAEEGLAAYKKTPEEAGVALFFSMKAASCSSRWCVAPGPPRAKRPSITVGTVAIGFRSSRPSACRPRVAGWDCTSPSTITTSSPMISSVSWRRCCVACNAGSSWSSIGGRFTVRGPDGCFVGFRVACTSSGCPPTPRNSTRTSRSGNTPSTTTWPTTSRKTFNRSAGPSADRSVGAEVSSSCCDRSFSTRNSDCKLLHCIFNGQ